MSERYDVVVIGAGAVGENAAGYAAGHGLSVAIVERELVGGECSYWACMPSKALLRPGEVLAEARRVPAAEGAVTGALDVAEAFKSRDAFASGWDDEPQVEWLTSEGVELVRGRGRLVGPRRVAIELPDGTQRDLEATRAVVLATGSRASFPPIEGLAEVEPWDNRAITTAEHVPARLLILGGGAVGVEMAQAFRRLGAREVTIVELFDRLLAVEEPFAGAELREAFEAEGITVHTDAETTRAERGADGRVTLTLGDGRTLTGDELLVATGREPATGDLGLDSVGLESGAPLRVDDRLRVEGVDGGWLYAVGDVNGRALLTHQGKYQARIAADVIAGRDMAAWADEHAVPRIVFTDPQVAAVGPTEQRARERGIPLTVLREDLSRTAAAALHGRGTTGSAQLLVDRDRGVVVGATFTGPRAAELVHGATIAIAGEVTLDALWHAVPGFPTLSEVWLRLLEQARER